MDGRRWLNAAMILLRRLVAIAAVGIAAAAAVRAPAPPPAAPPVNWNARGGHTPGSTSVEYQVRDGARTYRALSPGGVGIPNAEWSKSYLASTERLKGLGPWDVMLPNHPDMMLPRRIGELEPELKRERRARRTPSWRGRPGSTRGSTPSLR